MAEKIMFYKVGEYEILLNNVDAVSDIKKLAGGRHYFEIVVDGATLAIAKGTDDNGLIEERAELIKVWKECVK